jgi:hypothetical protein
MPSAIAVAERAVTRGQARKEAAVMPQIAWKQCREMIQRRIENITSAVGEDLNSKTNIHQASRRRLPQSQQLQNRYLPP